MCVEVSSPFICNGLIGIEKSRTQQDVQINSVLLIAIETFF